MTYLTNKLLILLAIAFQTAIANASPQATIVPQVLDLGKCASDESASGSVWIINTTKTPITVASAKGNCSCTTITDFVSQTLEPSQAKEIHVVMRASAKHQDLKVTKKVTIMLADGSSLTSNVRMESIHPLYAKLLGYRAAKKTHDAELISKYMAKESRIWFDDKTGPGTLRKPTGEGPWAGWDREMKSTGKILEYEVIDNKLVTVVTETNDYFKLLDREAKPYLLTYWFDENKKIEGMLVSKMPETKEKSNKYEEFKAWVDVNHPGAIAKLQTDEGNIIPSKENAIRWRKLLIEWRKATGLPEVNLREAS